MWPGDYCPHANENKKKYRLVVMESDGRVTVGRIFDSFEEVHEAMIELRVIYAKHGVNHHVGYMEA
jgi:hypothetical protein